jgi:hypothetical protein
VLIKNSEGMDNFKLAYRYIRKYPLPFFENYVTTTTNTVVVRVQYMEVVPDPEAEGCGVGSIYVMYVCTEE